MHIFVFLLIILGQFSFQLLGADVKFCCLRDFAKHESNKKLLNAILEQELSSQDISKRTPTDKANYLHGRIKHIASTLIKQGFAVEAYAIPQLDQNSVVSFSNFVLWNGENNSTGAIPLTFFIYVWPSEEVALKSNPHEPLNSRYGSIIHSHPISCAFAVLHGSLIQKNYEQIKSSSSEKSVRFVNEETFHVGEGDCDDLNKSKIHKLYNKGITSKIGLSLHAYGLSSADKVMECFRQTSYQCAYRCIEN